MLCVLVCACSVLIVGICCGWLRAMFGGSAGRGVSSARAYKPYKQQDRTGLRFTASLQFVMVWWRFAQSSFLRRSSSFVLVLIDTD